MRVSMERLLRGVVDYAGIFPPAKLSTPDALNRYLTARSGPERWILGRYVCGTDQLADLAAAMDQVSFDAPLAVSAVGRRSSDRATWENALVHDAEAMNAFHARIGDRAAIEAFEVRVPDGADIDACASDLRGFGEAEVFVELPLNDRIDDAIVRLADSDDLAAKLRTGGLEVSSIPSARSLAQFLRSCVQLELPFKLTAGLHSPLPHYDPAIRGRTHGFLNALTATALALSEDLSRREMEEILADEKPESWTFDDRGMRWREFGIDLAGIAETRELFTAFGSCSVDEPIQGLDELFCASAARVK